VPGLTGRLLPCRHAGHIAARLRLKIGHTTLALRFAPLREWAAAHFDPGRRRPDLGTTWVDRGLWGSCGNGGHEVFSDNKGRGLLAEEPAKSFAMRTAVQHPPKNIPPLCAAGTRKEKARADAAETLRRNLTSWSAVIYCTRVVRNIGMVLERYTLV
jgi:hypothetical protein